MTFEQALKHVLRYEGGYSNSSNDPGGATNFGITQKTYDAWRGVPRVASRPVRLITMPEVEAIYRTSYWAPCQAEKLPAALRMAHFDCAVNCGIVTAAKLLQRAAGVTDDGQIGPVTLAKVQVRGAALLDALLWERVRYYKDICLVKRSDGKDLKVFLPGWLVRVLDVREKSLKV